MTLMTLLVMSALLGTALMAGVFFAFSSFIMPALARLPAADGTAAMQSINVVVLNRSFLGAFFGTALLAVAIVILSLVSAPMPVAPWFIAGAACYLLGTFLVTVVGNVPLNQKLAALTGTEPDLDAGWREYLDRWTPLNTLRAVAAGMATLLFAAGLLKLAA